MEIVTVKLTAEEFNYARQIIALYAEQLAELNPGEKEPLVESILQKLEDADLAR